MEPFWSTGNTVQRIAFSPDSTRLACMRSNDVYVCDIGSPTKSRVLLPPNDTMLENQAWSHDSKSLAIIQRDSSIVVINKFHSDELDSNGFSDDEERWIDLKNAGKALLCGWNPNGWIAIISVSGRVMLSHSDEGNKWCQVVIQGSVAQIASTDSIWAFGLTRECIWLCSSDDGSLIKKIHIHHLSLLRSLSFFSAFENDSLLGSDENGVFLISKAKRLNSLALHGVLGCCWGEDASCFYVLCEEEGSLALLTYASTESSDGAINLIDRSLIVKCRHGIGLFDFNMTTKQILWGFDPGDGGYQVRLTLIRSAGKSWLAEDTVGLARDANMTCGVIAKDGHLIASLSDGVVQVSRVLDKQEQILRCLVAPYSFVEFCVDFLMVGVSLWLLVVALVGGGFPWHVSNGIVDLFLSPHHRVW